jgi:predicted permease
VLFARLMIPFLIGYAERLASPQLIFFNTDVDGLVIGFTALVACGSALVFGLAPALQSSRVDLVSVINEDASPRGAARGRLRSGLVVAQVAVSLLLLVGAGLASRSFEAAGRANPGFDPRQVTAIDLDVKQNAYDEVNGRTFYRKLLDEAAAAPGVESATLAAYAPLGLLDTRVQRVTLEGYELRKGEDLAFMWNAVGPDYFRTLRIDLAAGREFARRDDENGAPVAIVNTTLAQRFWGSAANAIGKRFRVGHKEWRTVVGVAADIKYSRITETPRPYFYLPFFQAYRSAMLLHTKGPAPLDGLVEQARATVAALDADLPIMAAKPMADLMRGALIFYRLAATMLFVFGVAGVALAAMGTYGLVSYTMKQSTHEIGIRIALGASALSLVRRFLVRGLRLGALGTALGTIAALGVSTLVRSALFGVSPTDPVSFARALALVLGVVIVATLIPAWRATRMDPLSALRHR